MYFRRLFVLFVTEKHEKAHFSLGKETKQCAKHAASLRRERVRGGKAQP